MAKVVNSKQKFEQCVQDANKKLVMVDFYASWCGPCKDIAPDVDKLAKDMKSEVVVLKVDVDKCEWLANYFEVDSMPTFVFIKNKEAIQKISSADIEKLKKTVNRLKG